MDGRVGSIVRQGWVWLGWWVVLAGVYLLLTGETEAAQVVAAVIEGALASALVMAVRGYARVRYRVRMAWLGVLMRRIPGELLRDLGTAAVALWKAVIEHERPEGVFRVVPFDTGGDDAESAGRRAMVVVGASIPVATYVITVDRKEQRLLAHQLTSRQSVPGEGDREWPV